jgi:hypothetical protein
MRQTGPPERRTPLARTAWPLARGQSLRRAPLARPQRPLMAAVPLGPPVCQGPASGAPRACVGGLHRHHVIPRGRGGQDVPENLVWLCAFHHQWTHEHPLDSRRLGLLA